MIPEALGTAAELHGPRPARGERYQWRIGPQLRPAGTTLAPGTHHRGPALADRCQSAPRPSPTCSLASSRAAAPTPGPAEQPVVRGRPAVVQARGLLRDPHPRLLRRQRRRLRRLPRPDREARLPAVARDRLHLAAAVLPVAAARRRLRHLRLHQGPPRLRHGRRRPAADRRRPRAPDPRDRRPGDEPHLERPPVVPGVALEPRQPQARLVRVVGHRRPLPATRGSSSSTPRPRTGPGTRSPAPTTGTASSPTSPTSTTTTPRSRRRCSTCCASGSTSASTASASTPCPYLFEREGTNCENLPETHAYLQARARGDRRRLPGPGAARRGQPVAGRRRRVLRRRRRVPDGASTSR